MAEYSGDLEFGDGLGNKEMPEKAAFKGQATREFLKKLPMGDSLVEKTVRALDSVRNMIAGHGGEK